MRLCHKVMRAPAELDGIPLVCTLRDLGKRLPTGCAQSVGGGGGGNRRSSRRRHRRGRLHSRLRPGRRAEGSCSSRPRRHPGPAGAPGLLALLAFHYFPLLGNVIAFQDYQPYLGFSGSPWIGVQNFAIIVNGDPEFLQALGNTLILTLIQTVFVFPVPLVLALLLNSLISERWKRTIQSILYLPHFLSWVIVVALFQQMLGNAGILNTFLIQQDLPAVARRRRAGAVQGLHHHPGDLEGRRLGNDHLPGRGAPGSTPTSTSRRPSTAPAA